MVLGGLAIGVLVAVCYAACLAAVAALGPTATVILQRANEIGRAFVGEMPAVGGGTQVGLKALEAAQYTIMKTVAKNLATRPYIISPSTISNIMRTGKGVADSSFKGGINYRVPGMFNGSQGIWELGINPETNTIYHFLFRSVK